MICVQRYVIMKFVFALLFCLTLYVESCKLTLSQMYDTPNCTETNFVSSGCYPNGFHCYSTFMFRCFENTSVIEMSTFANTDCQVWTCFFPKWPTCCFFSFSGSLDKRTKLDQSRLCSQHANRNDRIVEFLGTLIVFLFICRFNVCWNAPLHWRHLHHSSFIQNVCLFLLDCFYSVFEICLWNESKSSLESQNLSK